MAKVSKGPSRGGGRVPGQTRPQVAVNGTDVAGAKSNPEMAKRTADLLLSETKATLPWNVQNHVVEQSNVSSERARELQTAMANVHGKKSHE